MYSSEHSLLMCFGVVLYLPALEIQFRSMGSPSFPNGIATFSDRPRVSFDRGAHLALPHSHIVAVHEDSSDRQTCRLSHCDLADT